MGRLQGGEGCSDEGLGRSVGERWEGEEGVAEGVDFVEVSLESVWGSGVGVDDQNFRASFGALEPRSVCFSLQSTYSQKRAGHGICLSQDFVFLSESVSSPQAFGALQREPAIDRG